MTKKGSSGQVVVDKKQGIPVKIDRNGRVVERDEDENYSGPQMSREIYVDSSGKVYVGPGEGRKKMLPVPAYIDPETGMLYAKHKGHQIMFHEDEKTGALHYISMPVNKLRHEGHSELEGKLGEERLERKKKVAIAVGIMGILLGLVGFAPEISGNVVGDSEAPGFNVFAVILLALGLFALGIYFYYKSKK